MSTDHRARRFVFASCLVVTVVVAAGVATSCATKTPREAAEDRDVRLPKSLDRRIDSDFASCRAAIEIDRIDRTTVAASGCRTRITYVSVCSTSLNALGIRERACRWVTDQTQTIEPRNPRPRRASPGRGRRHAEAPRPDESAPRRGSLSRKEIQTVMIEATDAVRGCYDNELAGDPRLQGTVVTRFVIDREGRVSEVDAVDNTSGSPSLERCVLDVIAGLRFPRPRGAGFVLVTYPYVFTLEA